MTVQERWATLRDDRLQEGGYVAVMTGLLLMVLMGLAAFAVDVGQWYVVGQQEQRAADAAALAGVTKLPGDLPGAQTTALNFSKANRFENLPGATTNPTTVTAGLDGGRPTRLRVTVSRTVDNIFGPLLGLPKTTISRTAVADFGGPIPMGSPCNEFGNDPEPGSNRGAACSGVSGQLWANVNSPKSLKGNGDSYQSLTCASGVDGCGTGSGPNSDYSTDGYFYTVSVKAGMTGRLTIQLFDPVFVDVDLTCAASTSSKTTFFGKSGSSTAPLSTGAVNDYVSAGDAGTRYMPGASELYCTGDNIYSGTQVMKTEFTVREPSASLWNPATFTPVCQKTYPGYSGNLFKVLNKSSTATYDPAIAEGFRRWTELCTINTPKVGDYVIQVRTNVGGAFNNADAGNRFAIRAFGSNSLDKDSLSVSGRERMGIFSNKPGATTEFHLARIPSSTAGQSLKLSLFDIGDADSSGTVKIVSPPDAAGADFTGCVGVLSTNSPVTLTDCSLTVQRSTHNGKWQAISVPIPADYSCNDLDPAMCWVRLQYINGAQPTDVTTWAAGVDGDPVRLVE